ncbi:hypothetical protein BaRGS_00008579, partial [Batillaria attramentaria]
MPMIAGLPVTGLEADTAFCSGLMIPEALRRDSASPQSEIAMHACCLSELVWRYPVLGQMWNLEAVISVSGPLQFYLVLSRLQHNYVAGLWGL